MCQPKIYYVILPVFKYQNFFTDRESKEFLVECLKLYQQEYGLEICDWSIQPSGLKMIASSKLMPFRTLIKDFRSFTGFQIIDILKKGWIHMDNFTCDEHFTTDIGESIFWKGNFFTKILHDFDYYREKQKEVYSPSYRYKEEISMQENEYSSFNQKFGDKQSLEKLLTSSPNFADKFSIA